MKENLPVKQCMYCFEHKMITEFQFHLISGKPYKYCKKCDHEFFKYNPRDRLEFRDWRYLVRKNAKGKCQYCKKENGKLEAHHIKSVRWHPELTMELDNGVALCHECHVKVHRARKKREKRRGGYPQMIDPTMPFEQYQIYINMIDPFPKIKVQMPLNYF
jgi:hypothetical protein